jgi:Ras family protein T1
MPNSPFRILLLGDGTLYPEKVGKTSLIKSYVSKSFPHEVPAVSPVVVIPSELSESKTTVTIVDSLCISYLDRRDQEREEATEVEIRKTDVVLLVYDMSRLESLSRLGSFWLPWITRVTKVPIILVGNKADMRTAGVPTPEETLSGLIRDYPQCVFATECNVLTLANTDTVFYYAHYAVLYPTAPLYDPIRHELTPKFTRAMQLCFRRLDKDQDRCLNDRELNDLQVGTKQTQVFNTRFKDNELESLKDLIKAENQEGVVANGVTFGGFLVLQKLLIKKLNGNVCWSLLRHFGFNDELELELDFRLELQPAQSVELSPDTCAFLTVLFESYSTDGRLTLAGLQDIFSTVEVPFWADSESEKQWSEVGLHVPTESDGSLVLSSWLAVWFLYCYIDYKVIYHYLVLLGLSLPKSNVFVLTKPKEVAKSNNKRKVFLCYVYGDEGVGKNSFLLSFLSRPSDIADTHLDTVCALVEGDRRLGESYYLIVHYHVAASEDEYYRSGSLRCLLPAARWLLRISGVFERRGDTKYTGDDSKADSEDKGGRGGCQ